MSYTFHCFARLIIVSSVTDAAKYINSFKLMYHFHFPSVVLELCHPFIS
jgi:hypothetical protein